MQLKLFFLGLLISNGVLAQSLNEHGGIYGFSENLLYVVSDNGIFLNRKMEALVGLNITAAYTLNSTI